MKSLVGGVSELQGGLMNTRRIVPSLLAIMLVMALTVVGAGCGGDDSGGAGSVTTQAGSVGSDTTQAGAGETSTPTSVALQSFLVGDACPVAAEPNQNAITYGQNEAAKQLGGEVKTLDANLSANKQATDVETLISLKANGITSWTLDVGATAGVYEKAQKAGIPIVTFNSRGDFVNTVIAQEVVSTKTVSQADAKYIAERTPGAKVAIIALDAVPSLKFYTDAFEEAAKAAGLQVVARQSNSDNTPAGAQTIAQNFLTTHPDLQAIWAYGDQSAVGAGAAVQAAGKKIWSGDTKGIIILGRNGTVEGADAIKAGAITTSADPNSPLAGAISVKLISMVVRGEMKIEDMPKEIIVPATRYDLSNIDQFIPPLERKIDINEVKVQ